jgi:hypothetical protein
MRWAAASPAGGLRLQSPAHLPSLLINLPARWPAPLLCCFPCSYPRYPSPGVLRPYLLDLEDCPEAYSVRLFNATGRGRRNDARELLAGLPQAARLFSAGAPSASWLF